MPSRKRPQREVEEAPRVLLPTRTPRARRLKTFIERYMPVPDGPFVGQKMDLLPEQDDFLEGVYGNVSEDPSFKYGKLVTRTGILSVGRKNGKALALDTPIPTPGGFTTMGALRVGDTVFDEKGAPCRVVLKSKVFTGHACYRVSFSDGTDVVCDADHLWETIDKRNVRRVVTAARMYETGVLKPGNRKAYRWHIPVMQGPAQHGEKELPLPPYVLGYWLGDGSSRSGVLTVGAEDVLETVRNVSAELSGFLGGKTAPYKWERTAYSVLLSTGEASRGDRTVHKVLRSLGVLNNKHIPEMYLTASPEQRWALLQGIMDSDGTVHAGAAVPVSRRMCVYSSTSEALARGVLRLIRSLGFRSAITRRVPTLNGRDCSPSWRMQFSADDRHPVFRLKRKKAKLKPYAGKPTRSDKKSVVAIDPVDSVKTQCIQVDSASRLYLCGEAYTVTHNTGLIAPILGAHLIGPEAKQNSTVHSAARSRDQASLVFNYLAKSLRLRKDLDGLVQITDSTKRIRGLALNTEYRALSADATTAYGLSPALTIHDELGQVVGPTDHLFDALETSVGAQAEPLSLIISTQAAGDADLLSTLIDDALRNPTPETVVRLYAAGKEDDIFSRSTWLKANFALGKFRNEKELADAAEKARRLPAFEAAFRNLYLNQRVSLLQLLVAPSTWKLNSAAPDLALFTSGLPVHVGADLSQSRDLTAVILSVEEPGTGVVHILPFVFTPQEGLEQRAKQDRAPYVQWHKDGYLIALPGKNVNYDMVAEFMAEKTEGMSIASVQFDRWRIDLFRKSCETKKFAVSPEVRWCPVGQGFRDMSPRIEKFEELLVDEKLAHGGHPLLNMAAANAVVVMDPAKNKKVEKAKSSARIDPLVAAIMSVYGAVGPEEDDKSPPVIDENSFFFL